jgi:hypothetical protein
VVSGSDLPGLSSICGANDKAVLEIVLQFRRVTCPVTKLTSGFWRFLIRVGGSRQFQPSGPTPRRKEIVYQTFWTAFSGAVARSSPSPHLAARRCALPSWT